MCISFILLDAVSTSMFKQGDASLWEMLSLKLSIFVGLTDEALYLQIFIASLELKRIYSEF